MPAAFPAIMADAHELNSPPRSDWYGTPSTLA